ncbi:MAG: nucleotidyltransferase domain-containing protein [Verrucomicrobiia bacterium]|jgi:predicted nucleotidyltransferase
MVRMRDVRELSARIADEFRPSKIILFGSLAEGRAHAESDVDLMVIMPFAGRAAEQGRRILERVAPRLPVDLMVRTPAQVRRRVAQNDFFLKDVLSKGKLLYEASHA